MSATSEVAPPGKAFEGDFLFVNHSAKQMKASPHRRRVFTHVQSQYRRWKRQEDIRALRASVKAPLRHSQSTHPLKKSTSTPKSTPRHKPVAAPDANPKSPSTKTPPKPAEVQPRNAKKPAGTVAAHTEGAQPPASPLTVLRQGNSDPFNTYAVKINSAANNMIGFYRDYVLPAMYHTTARKWVTSSSARRDWRDCIGGLEDTGAGTGFLASCATVAAIVSANPVIQNQALRYRSESMAMLRQRLESEKKIRRQTYWHIIMLLGAETLDSNHPAASAHINMMRHFFEADPGAVDLDFLLYVVYHDTQVAALFLCPPILDPDRWLPSRCQPIFDAAAPLLPPTLPAIRLRFLDPSIDDPFLRTLFIERRESLAVWLVQSQSEEAEHAELLLAWLQARVYLHLGRLVKKFLRAKARLKSSPPTKLHNYTCCQAYLPLATMLYVRSISFTTVICGIRLMDATARLLTNLQEMLQLSEDRRLPHYAKYQYARLWALYVGASAELFAGKSPSDHGWFTTRFGEKAASMHLLTWDDVRAVLQGFLFTDMMHPDGEEWFESILDMKTKGGKGTSPDKVT